MRLSFPSDADWDSGLDKVLHELCASRLARSFEVEDYGPTLRNIVVVFMCLDLEFQWKKRLRFVRKEATIYTDVVLGYSEFKRLTHEERKRVVASALLEEMTFLMAKYKIPEFDKPRFLRLVRRRIMALKWV